MSRYFSSKIVSHADLAIWNEMEVDNKGITNGAIIEFVT